MSIQLPPYTRTRIDASAIAGGVLGGVVLLVAIGAFVLFWRRRRLRQKAARTKEDITPYVGVGLPVTGGHDSSANDLQNYLDNTNLDNGGILPFTGLPRPEVDPNAKGSVLPLLQGSTPQTPQDSNSKSASRNVASGILQLLSPSRTLLLTNSESRIETHSRGASTASLNMPAAPLASSSTGQEELIVEVQQLRREMEELRARQGADEPPPLYRDSDMA